MAKRLVEDQEGGLSPRGRGNLTPSRARARWCGSIPAWAGKPTSNRSTFAVTAVYPRVGGETFFTLVFFTTKSGLSPRGRGNRLLQPAGPARGRSIPAWAGKPYGCHRMHHQLRVYPRVGGETENIEVTHAAIDGLSPRGRGNRRQRRHCRQTRGSIPAWAGKPATPMPAPRQLGVYPRVGGETGRSYKDHEIEDGLSPRGRGNLVHGP